MSACQNERERMIGETLEVVEVILDGLRDILLGKLERELKTNDDLTFWNDAKCVLEDKLLEVLTIVCSEMSEASL